MGTLYSPALVFQGSKATPRSKAERAKRLEATPGI